MTVAVIVDTNIVIAGLLTSREDSPVARMLDGMLAATFPFVVSHALLAEYRAVLERPALRKVHGLTAEEIEILMLTLAEHAIVLTPVATLPAPDPGDQHLWELLAAHADVRLVTGDKLLLGAHACASRMTTAQEFIRQLDAQLGSGSGKT